MGELIALVVIVFVFYVLPEIYDRIPQKPRKVPEKKKTENKKSAPQFEIFQIRIKSETGIDDPNIRERIVKNTGKIERAYRAKNRIPQEQRLYGPKYISDDFFGFYLGYILDDKLFDHHQWLIEEEGKTAEAGELPVKSKVKIDDVKKIIMDYKHVAAKPGEFQLRGGYAKYVPNEFRGFILGHYAGAYRVKTEDLAKMCWSWQVTKVAADSEMPQHIEQPAQSTSVKAEVKKPGTAATYERKPEPDYVVMAKGMVADTSRSRPKTNYGVIAKQMAVGNDPYSAIWDRMRNDIGIDHARFKRRLTHNTARLENIYRKQRNISAGKELYNRREYVGDDFFAFILGYILADHLFDGDDKMIAEAATRNSGEVEVEPEYEDVNSWDEFDFSELEFMEPWERRQALEDAGLDPDDFDFDYDDFDSDSGSTSRRVTFQDDYGYDGDDMYSFDGEFIE